ncbi:MAG: hypothetical protein Q9P44_01470 [Anaerolineae bacterium]|nr:hypothetical protein [Anaerolineae bacterium]
MPRYDYVIERFKRYDAWRSVSHTGSEHTFRAVHSSTQLVYRYGWLGAAALLILVFMWTYQQFPAERVDEMTLEDFGALVRDRRATGLELTATACPDGIIGEIENDQIYWVELGYSGARWTATYDLPESVWAEQCTPPIFVQSQRLELLLVATLLVTLFYGGINAVVMARKWSPIQAITIRESSDSVVITEGGQELNASTYVQLDERFNLATDNISFRRVLSAAIVLAVIGVLLAILAAYII